MSKIEIKELVGLDPDKIYFMKMPENLDPNDMMDIVEDFERLSKTENIKIIVIRPDLEFVNIPKGYEVVKTDE